MLQGKRSSRSEVQNPLCHFSPHSQMLKKTRPKWVHENNVCPCSNWRCFQRFPKKRLFNLLKMEEVHVSKASRLLIGGYGQCFSSFGFGLTTSGHMSSCQLVGVKYDVALSSRIPIPQIHKTSIFSPMWRRHRSAPDGTWREGGAWDVQSPPLRPDWIRDERNIKFCVSWSCTCGSKALSGDLVLPWSPICECMTLNIPSLLQTDEHGGKWRWCLRKKGKREK